jgi:hypothetical protein
MYNCRNKGIIFNFVLITFLSIIFPLHLFGKDKEHRFLFKPVPVSKKAALSPGEEKEIKRLKEIKTTAGIQVMEINLKVLLSKSITLNPEDDKAFDAITDSIEKRSEKDFTWFGKIPSLAETGSAVLVVKNGQVTGSIRAGEELFEVVPLGSGRHAIVKVDQTKLPSDEGGHPEKIERLQRELREKYTKESPGERDRAEDRAASQKHRQRSRIQKGGCFMQ